MEIPFDILDYIFSLLKSHPKSLVACSKAHPSFSQIVERHLYYHIIIHTGVTDFSYSFEPSSLIKLLSETPRIVDYVRNLQIEFHFHLSQVAPYLEEMAPILPMFPGLECIMLTGCVLSWQNLPESFKSAVESCLNRPTLQEVHIGKIHFPLSVLDNHANVKYFSLSGDPKIPDCLDTSYPQLKSLSFEGVGMASIASFSTWAKHHILKLQSLKCNYSSDQIILELLDICSDTLNNLDLNLGCRPYRTSYDLQRGSVERHGDPVSINLSSLPFLQHITVRADVYFDCGRCSGDEYLDCFSSLPAAVQILKTAASQQHLTLEISVIGLSECQCPCFDDIDFAPLIDLAKLKSFHQIDLYIHSDSLRPISHTYILGLLLLHGMTEGVMVVHPPDDALIFPNTY